ncbi:MAG TPA: PilC/PilY family type IV pilus protein [Gammaproteobacteria bacterium]|nr:PilC/PilY family type IV pilus protein [Gammaproteobacteria bacterium]
MNIQRCMHSIKNVMTVLCSSVLVLGLSQSIDSAVAATPPTSISDVPLTLVQPTHPQVLILLGNSQSMDGNLSGAIMTGSGNTTGVTSETSSPTKYVVPDGFTPPCVSTIDADGKAPYTAVVDSGYCDNSASRLNVAKASIMAILQQYSGNTDFGLMDFDTGTDTPNFMKTWVYYMSPEGGFTFSDTPPTGTEGVDWVNNPCYNKTNAACTAVSNHYAGLSITNRRYVKIAGSSDQPSVNDVLYSSSNLPDAFVVYNGIYDGLVLTYSGLQCSSTAVSGPYPDDFTLDDYKQGDISICYKSATDLSGPFSTGPTNAGYVAYTDEVMYAKRGFGYYTTGVSATDGNLLVPVKPVECSVSSTFCGHPTQTDINSYVATFADFLQPETNDASSSEIKSLAAQSALPGLLKGAYDYFTGTSAPVASNGCTAQRYVVLMTDGLPTKDLLGNNWPPLGSDAATGYSVTATNDQALIDTLSEIKALKDAGIKTYVVGLGAGVDSSKNPDAAAALTAMAVAGGTEDYFPATTPQEVATDMQVIMAQVEAANLTTTAAAVNSTGLRSDTTVYQGQFESQDQYGDWTGNLFAYPVASDGSVDTDPSSAKWSGQDTLDGQDWNTGRLIVTWDPTANNGEPFRHAAASFTTTNTLGLELMKGSGTTLDATHLANVVEYLRGNVDQEQRNDGDYRSRAHILGDIVDSNPLFIGAPRRYIANSSYISFQTDNADRMPMLYVGANDGFLHAFSASSGKEIFAFAPFATLSTMYDLTQPNYNNAHRFYVDGSPNGGDVQFADDSWHTVLIGGLDHGGKGIYAIDVTDPASMTSEAAVAADVLWEDDSTTAGFENLGYTYSQPQIGDVCLSFDADTGLCTSDQWIAVFGSGYNNADGNPYLYIVNPETGTLLGSLALCSGNTAACDTTLPNGASTPALVASQGGVFDDVVYIGDLQGNLWRVNLNCSSATSCSPSDSLLFKAKTSAGVQPITTQPVVSFHPGHPTRGGLMVYFGTGKFLGKSDLTDTAQRTFFGVWDKSPDTASTSAIVNSDRTQLVQQVLSTTSVTVDSETVLARTVTSNTIDWDTQLGWYVNLPASGERLINDPRLDKGRLIFTTYVPSATGSTTVCEAGGTSFLMVLNYINGGAFNEPEIDIDNDSDLDGDDKVDVGTADNPDKENPVGIGLGEGYATSPTILRTSQGSIGDIKLITKSNNKITPVKERGSNHQRSSWKQIQ